MTTMIARVLVCFSFISEQVRFYAVSMPMINVTRFPDNSGSGFVNLSLSGYLADQ